MDISLMREINHLQQMVYYNFFQQLPMYAEAPFIKNTFKFTKYETLTEDTLALLIIIISNKSISDEDVN